MADYLKNNKNENIYTKTYRMQLKPQNFTVKKAE